MSASSRASANHMSDHRMALLPFSTLATYAPEGDQDTELMAELQKQQEIKVFICAEPPDSTDKNHHFSSQITSFKQKDGNKTQNVLVWSELTYSGSTHVRLLVVSY